MRGEHGRANSCIARQGLRDAGLPNASDARARHHCSTIQAANKITTIAKNQEKAWLSKS